MVKKKKLIFKCYGEIGCIGLYTMNNNIPKYRASVWTDWPKHMISLRNITKFFNT